MDKEEITTRMMLIDEAIANLRHFSKLFGLDSIFVVGGFCRGMYMDRIWEINDIDVASAYENQALELGGLFASEVAEVVPQFYHRSGAAMVPFKSQFGEIKIEFQGRSTHSYMNNQEIRDWMHNNDIDDVPLMHNLYGRDFTINTLVFSLANEHLYDPIHKAVRDFDHRRIVSVLPPEMLIKNNPLAALRAIRFAITYDFMIDENLQAVMQNTYEVLVSSVSKDRIVKEIVRILKINGRKAIKELQRYKLDRILLDERVKDYIHMEGRDEE